MKKLLSVLLALSLMVSMLTVGTFATDTDTTNPTVVSAVAISDTQIQVTISEPIYVKNTSCWALFFAKDGVVDTSLRVGGTVGVEAGTLCSQFVWTIDSGSVTSTIISKTQAGYEAYFGINTNNTYDEIAADRATDEAGNMFLRNVASNGYSIHAISADPYYNGVRSVTFADELNLEIEFWYPITEFVEGTNAILLLGVLNAAKTDWYFNSGESITTTKRLTATVTERGTLICPLNEDLAGMSSGDERNIAKYAETVNAAYAEQGYCAGIRILEPSTALLNDGLLESVKTEDGVALWGPQSTNGRASCYAAISTDVASIGYTKYATLTEAMASAKTGDEIDLINYVKAEDALFVLDADVTLDLNGHTLTANNVMAFGDVIDSTEGAGKLATPAAGRVILKTNNSAMPLYDTDNGCYRFYTYTLAAAGPQDGTADAVSFGVQITFKNTDAYALLAKDANATVDMALSVTKDEKVTNLTFTFSRATLTNYNTAWTDPDRDTSKTPTLVLTVSGLTGTDSISCTPSINQSTTTVSQSGSELTYSVNA